MKIFDPKLTGSIEIQSQVSGSIIPTTTEVFDLGSTTNRWNDIYLAGSTIDLGGTKMTKDASGNIEFKDGSNNRKKVIVEEILIGSGNNQKRIKVDDGKLSMTDKDGNADTQMVGHMMPHGHNQYDLGSPTAQWRDLYLSSASLYIDGTQVLSSDSNVLTVSTDTGQSLKLLETGADDITLQTDTGNIELKGTVEILSGKKIIDSAGTVIQFGDSLGVTGSISVSGTVDGIDLQAMSSSLASRISSLDNEYATDAELNAVSASVKTFATNADTTLSSSLAADIKTNDGRLDTLEGKTLISGSAQIASDISGSNTAFSASVASRFEGLTTNYNELDNIPTNIVSGSAQITSFGALMDSEVTDLSLIKGLTQAKISGSFTAASASLASNVATNNSSITSLNAATSSYLQNTTDTLTGNLTVTGTLTAQQFNTEYVSASILFDSGSTKFGDSSDDLHQFTGSVKIAEGMLYVWNSNTSNYIRIFGGSSGNFIDNYGTDLYIRPGADSTKSVVIYTSGNTEIKKNLTVKGTTTSEGNLTAPKLIMGSTQLYKSGDNNHIHFVGTALIGTSTTASSNPKIGTSTYPFSQVHAGYYYGDGSNLTGRIGLATSASHAEYADNATSATSATSAASATSASSVPYSGLTGTVPTWNQNTTGNAATATTASYIAASNIHGTVATATSASHAEYADNATSATSATSAATATSASHAEYADNAGTLGGINPGSFIRSDAADTTTGVLTMSSTSAIPLKLINGNSSYTAISIANTGSGQAGVYMDASNGDFIGSDYAFVGQTNDKHLLFNVGSSGGDILFEQYGSERMRIKGGNVGIGTTSPSSLLHLAGASVQLFVENTSSSGQAYIQFKARSDRNAGPFIKSTARGGAASDSDLQLGDENGTTMTLNGGRVGIGTLSATHTLSVVGEVSASAYHGDGSNLTGRIGLATSASHAEYADNATSATSATTATSASSVPYSGLTGTVPTWNQDTTGTAAQANNLNAFDDRDVAPEDLSFSDDLRIAFAEKSGIEGGTIGSDYQDLLILNSYTDASGGKMNALAFDKSTYRLLHYNANYNATNWGTPKQIAYTESDITGNAATATSASHAEYADAATNALQLGGVSAANYLRTTSDTFVGNLLIYGTDTSGGYGTAAIEIGEIGNVGSAQSAYAYSPALAFHWGGRKQAQIRLHSDGELYIDGSQYAISGGVGKKIWHEGNDGPTSGLAAQTAASATSASHAEYADNATSATSATSASSVPYSGLTGTVPTWNQSTTGNAATATSASHAEYADAATSATSATNADTVDSLHASSFLRSDAADTATGQLFFDAGFDSHPIMLSGAQNFDNIDRSGFYNLYNTHNSSTNSPGFHYGTMITIGNDKGSAGFGFQLAHERTGTGMYVRGMNDTASTWSAWAEIWTSTTDGAGSGLDADKLDGLEGTSFLRSDTDDTMEGHLTIDASSGNSQLTLRFDTTGDSTIIGDINWNSTSAEGTDDRLGIIRTRTQGGTTSTRGGEMVFYTRKTASGFNTTTYANDGQWTFPNSINLTAGQVKLRDDVALDHDGNALYIKAPSTIFFYPGNSNKANINTAGTLQLAGNLDVNGTGTSTIDGNLTVAGTLTAQQFHTEYVSSSILHESGSTSFGNSSDDVHNFTGSLNVQGNISHEGITPTSGTDIDQIKTFSQSLTVTTSWSDTGINGTDLETGTYIIQLHTNNHGVGGGHYDERYSGTMSWYSSNPNSTDSDEIVLHKAGHAPNGNHIYLRTIRTLSADTDDLKLQIASTATTTGNSTYTFKFRRMI